MDCQSVFPDRLPVFFRGVPLVVFPSVHGKITVQAGHVLVAECFGQDRGCGDRRKTPVAPYKALVGYYGAEQGIAAPGW